MYDTHHIPPGPHALLLRREPVPGAPPGGAGLPTPGDDPAAVDAEERRIRCPRCGWHHDWQPHWWCELCDAVFDTFVTRAHCPNPDCGNSWKLTACPECHAFSPHEEWYER